VKSILLVWLLMTGLTTAQEEPVTGESSQEVSELLEDLFPLDDSMSVVTDPVLSGAIASMEAGENATAAEELEDILLQAPGHLQALRLLASCYMRLNEPENAIASCVEIASLDSVDATAHVALGYLYQKMGDPDNAELYYSLALERDPVAHHALFGIGWMHLERRNLDAAHDAATRITEIAPEYAPNYILLGRVLTIKGFYKEAALAYRRGFGLVPELRTRYGILLQELSQRHRLSR
jgi:tetratricopeptide (TPR) repeat protein